MAEGEDLKSPGSAFEGSNPSPATTIPKPNHNGTSGTITRMITLVTHRDNWYVYTIA